VNGPRSASIVINNRDYGRFLSQAIESALAQSWPETEVIVVDDGSRDGSREVIARYRGRVEVILKENGGQASAFNAGFDISSGDVVVFLDADDALCPSAIERALAAFGEQDVVKVHWPLDVIDENGRRTGQRYPDSPLPDGDRRAALLRAGPTTELSPPTSGNAWARTFLDAVLPMPEALYHISADKYLMELAPFFGTLRALHDPLSLYRRHGRGSQLDTPLEARLARELAFYDHYTAVVCEHLAGLGLTVDLDAWRLNSWWHRQQRALRDIAALPPSNDPLILVDDGSWGSGTLAGRRRLPFLERDGQYWGQPSDDATAIEELERMRDGGASFMLFVWATFWWLDHYPKLHEHLRHRYARIIDNDCLIAFDLRELSGNRGQR
jgi:glycosyltransferase involved in cell wall biosynthesis